MTLQFAVLGSGSRGNSALVCHDGGTGLLIDIGLGPRALDQRLASVQSDWSRISAVLLTHTHGDHIDSATLQLMIDAGLCSIATRPTATLSRSTRGFKISTGWAWCGTTTASPSWPPAAFGSNQFPCSMTDRRSASGSRRSPGGGRGPSAWATWPTAGSWSDSMADSLADVDVLGVEFNHDVAMQKASGRSSALIARNLGDRGHLSNRQAAELVRSILKRSSRDRVGHLVLLHLSEQCNRPELAIHEAREVVQDTGRRILIHAARQSPAHPNLIVEAYRNMTQANLPTPGRPRSSTCAPGALAGHGDVARPEPGTPLRSPDLKPS